MIGNSDHEIRGEHFEPHRGVFEHRLTSNVQESVWQAYRKVSEDINKGISSLVSQRRNERLTLFRNRSSNVLILVFRISDVSTDIEENVLLI